SSPALRIRRASVELISPTPPPNAVAERCRTRDPSIGSASRWISAMRPRPRSVEYSPSTLVPTLTSESIRGLRPRARARIPGLTRVLDELYEPEARTLPVHSGAGLELVRSPADARDAEAALVEHLFRHRRRFGERETLAVVGHLDDEPVGMKLVDDLDRSFAAAAVCVPDGCRACLGHRELEIAERLVREAPEVRKPAEREADQHDVFGLGRNRQPDDSFAAVDSRCRGTR